VIDQEILDAILLLIAAGFTVEIVLDDMEVPDDSE